jgi:hypothetical protein
MGFIPILFLFYYFSDTITTGTHAIRKIINDIKSIKNPIVLLNKNCCIYEVNKTLRSDEEMMVKKLLTGVFQAVS